MKICDLIKISKCIVSIFLSFSFFISFNLSVCPTVVYSPCLCVLFLPPYVCCSSLYLLSFPFLFSPSWNGRVIRLKFVNLFNKLKTPRQRLENLNIKLISAFYLLFALHYLHYLHYTSNKSRFAFHFHLYCRHSSRSRNEMQFFLFLLQLCQKKTFLLSV